MIYPKIYSLIIMESSQIDEYKKLLGQFISLYTNIQEIFSINLNDALKSNNYNKLLSSKLIKDTEAILSQYNFDINKILSLTFTNEIENTFDKDNYFIKYAYEYEKLLNNNLIINNEDYNEIFEGHFLQNKDRNKIYKYKKEHEVKKLSDFIKSSQSNSHCNVLLEIGCGKSYLTDALLSTNNANNLIYIGVDMNKNVIDRAKQIYKKYKNVYLLNDFIKFDSFDEFYENNVKGILKENNKSDEKIFLFGLHSCGNLTSNSLKIFIKNNYFKSIAIVGCCLHLLNEYISPETKSSKEFKEFYSGIGYGKNGRFLDNTLIYEINGNMDNIGYPLSEHIKNNYKYLFFGRDVRNAAMLNSIENAPFESISTQKNFYRALLQKFLEDNLEEYGNVYGLGKNKYIDKCTFSEYVKDFLLQIRKKEENEKILKKIDELIKNIESIGSKFYEDNKLNISKHYALNLIRIKFAKIVEFIVVLDRIIYLIEQGITNIKLIRIFNNHISPRNLLIYATKD